MTQVHEGHGMTLTQKVDKRKADDCQKSCQMNCKTLAELNRTNSGLITLKECLTENFRCTLS